MRQENNAEFALRVAEQILGQIESDRTINKQNIAFLIEREIAARPVPNMSAVALRAKALQNVLRDIQNVKWSQEAVDAYQALSDALLDEGAKL